MDFEQLSIIAMVAYVESLKEYRKEYESTVNLANKMIKFQKFLPFIMLAAGFMYGFFTNDFLVFSNATLHCASVGFLFSIPLQLFSYLYWGIVKRVNNNKMVGIDYNIECVLAAKKEMEERLELQKGMERDNIMERYNQIMEIEIVNECEDEIDKPKKRVRKLNSRKKK